MGQLQITNTESLATCLAQTRASPAVDVTGGVRPPIRDATPWCVRGTSRSRFFAECSRNFFFAGKGCIHILEVNMHSTSPSYRKDLDETRNYSKVQIGATVLLLRQNWPLSVLQSQRSTPQQQTTFRIHPDLETDTN